MPEIVGLPTANNNDTTTAYAYVLVLKIAMGGSDHILIERNGTFDVPHGTTRYDLFTHLRTAMLDEARGRGLPGYATTEFWSLEPNTL